MVEDVEALLRLRAALLDAKDEVDPLVQMRRDVLALERLAVARDEVVRRGGPRRQAHVVDAVAVLPLAQVEAVGVAEELRLAASRERRVESQVVVGEVGKLACAVGELNGSVRWCCTW